MPCQARRVISALSATVSLSLVLKIRQRLQEMQHQTPHDSGILAIRATRSCGKIISMLPPLWCFRAVFPSVLRGIAAM